MTRRYRECHSCQGAGYLPNSPARCTRCQGTGRHYYKGMLSSESQMVPALKSYFEAQGYHVLEDPGGGSFFDVVVIKVDIEAPEHGTQVGFVELKLASAPRTAVQALHRLRAFTGDWAAICHPSRKALETLMRESRKDEKAGEAVNTGNITDKNPLVDTVDGISTEQSSSKAEMTNLGCLWFHGGQITPLRSWTLRPPPRPGYTGPWPLLWEERSIAYRRLVQMAVVERKGLDPEVFWGHARGCSRSALLHDVDYINDRPAPALDDFGPGEATEQNEERHESSRAGAGSVLLPAGQRSLKAYSRRAGKDMESKD